MLKDLFSKFLFFIGPDGVELEFELPPKEIMAKILDNIEAQLPREDHVKYDSRAKKLDWEKICIDGYTSEQCKKLWYFIQDRIRRFRYTVWKFQKIPAIQILREPNLEVIMYKLQNCHLKLQI